MRHITAPGTIRTTDGLSLAVQHHTLAQGAPGEESSAPRASPPTIVAVHGYPDNGAVWNALVPHLIGHCNVVTFDVRGTGGSDAPTTRNGYLLPQLVADVDAVLTWAEQRTNGRVHLLAHDWGSIQAWQAVTDTGSTSRVASFTSISGPCLDHVDRWIRQGLRRGSGNTREVLQQLAHSSYIAFFKVRGLAEFAGSTGLLARVMRSATNNSEDVPGFVRTRRDITNGLELYRQNMLTRKRSSPDATAVPKGPRTTDVPVQVITPLADPYVRPALGACGRIFVPDITVSEIDGDHWAVTSSPSEVAALVLSFIETHAGSVPLRNDSTPQEA